MRGPIKIYSVWTCGHWWFHSSEKRSHRNQTQLKMEGWRQFVKLLQRHYHLPTLPGWRGRKEKIKGELANSPSLAGPEAKMKAEICWASSWTRKLSDMQTKNCQYISDSKTKQACVCSLFSFPLASWSIFNYPLLLSFELIKIRN